MISPNAGYGYTSVSAAGTSVLSAQPSFIHRILIPGTYVGTVVLQDAATTAGTSAATPIFTIGLPATAIPQSIELNIQTKRGLQYEATGTPVMSIIWS